MLRIAMNAPIMHATTATQSLALARGWDSALAAENVIEFAMTPTLRGSPALVLARSLHAGGRLGVDARRHRHAGPQIAGAGAVAVEHDLDGDPLHHLGEIAGGVVRRQQRESLAAGRREAVDAAVVDAAGEHIDLD